MINLTREETDFLLHLLKNVVPSMSVPLKDAEAVSLLVASLVKKVEGGE
jgi:hypothetical protein